MQRREQEREPEAPAAPTPTPAAPAPAAADPQAGVLSADAGTRNASMLMLQRTAGNAAAARVAAASGPVIARRRRQAPAPTGTVASENGAVEEIQGTTITAGEGNDPETQREMDIQRGLADTMTEARVRMLETRTAVSSATESFRDYAIGRIDAMDGAPSGYWAVAGGLATAAAGVIGTIFPPAAIALAIGAAVEAAVQASITEEVGNARADAKEQAKQAMRRFATATRDGFDQGSERARSPQGPIYQRLWMMSLTDEEARVRFESASVEDKAALLDAVGVSDPATNNAFELTLRALVDRFSVWMGQQTYANQWGTTGFDEMLADHPGTEQHAERQGLVGAEQGAGSRFADEAVRGRRGSR